MTRSTVLLAAGAAVLAGLSVAALAQGTLQTVTLMKVDQTTLAKGYRTTKVVGSSVQNEAQQTIGTIDDLIVTPTAQVPFAVLSVGGFLGMGTRFVIVPANQLTVVDNHMLLRGGTKESLQALPSFQYAY
jgi:hypothetical protein